MNKIVKEKGFNIWNTSKGYEDFILNFAHKGMYIEEAVINDVDDVIDAKLREHQDNLNALQALRNKTVMLLTDAQNKVIKNRVRKELSNEEYAKFDTLSTAISVLTTLLDRRMRAAKE